MKDTTFTCSGLLAYWYSQLCIMLTFEIRVTYPPPLYVPVQQPRAPSASARRDIRNSVSVFLAASS